MPKSILTILQFFFISILAAQQHIRINVDSLPPEPLTRDLFLAGSFNNWNPGDEQFRLRRMGNGRFYIDLEFPAGSYEYKVTRGSWKEVECGADGADIANRVLQVSRDETLSINIAAWKDRFGESPKNHTASPYVKLIDTAFLIPQLNRTRRVWIYLPAGYSTASMSQRYPVLYLHDGQNVFDNATSFSGEWGVDEFMDTTRSGKSIVVAIDNGGIRRLNEYCPYDFSPKSLGLSAKDSLHRGEGKLYVDFLVNTLKPYIDKNYRTLKGKSNTFVAGSSMGGLISMYAILKYPKVFGGAGVFSPAFWVGPKIFDDIKAMGKKVRSRIFFYAGKQESEFMVPDMLRAFDRMSEVSKSKMKAVIRDEGKHNESTWRKEFPFFYNWILQ